MVIVGVKMLIWMKHAIAFEIVARGLAAGYCHAVVQGVLDHLHPSIR